MLLRFHRSNIFRSIRLINRQKQLSQQDDN